jgi:two-component system, OmpR family, response regulator
MAGWKVLLVDDEKEFAATLAERLTLRGLITVTANDGQQALRCMEQDRPQIVILDMKMPGMSGLEVLRLIKQKCPTIPVILLTGQDTTKDSMEGMDVGAFDYMVKPVKIEELLQKMREALGQAGTKNTVKKG